MAVPRMDILSENVGRYKMVFRLFSFSTCYPAKTEVSYDTTEGGIGLEKDSALYQLMDGFIKRNPAADRPLCQRAERA